MPRRSRSRSSRPVQRDAAAIARADRLDRALPDELLRPVTLRPRLVDPLEDLASLTEIEDRRTFYPGSSPLAYAPARPLTASLSPVRLRVGTTPHGKPNRVLVDLPSTVAFRQPDAVVVCARRRLRRELMFASGYAGRTFRRRAHPRRSPYSGISCQR